MDANESETRVLVGRAAAGDKAAVDALMSGHRGRLKQMVRLRMDPRLRARVDPSDVIQETLATASRQLPGYLQTQAIPFYPWLRRIAWQQLAHLHERHLDAEKRSIRREQHRTWEVSDDSARQLVNLLAGSLSTPSMAAAKKETRHRVQTALDELSDIDREVLLERYVEQLSIQEIAATLQITVSAAYKRHARALEKIRTALEESTR
jgi:RNA polymerase sigma-70 factor (ECF subfamily)